MSDRERNINDPYARQYEEQLREFSRMAGEDGMEGDLSMHSMNETFEGHSDPYGDPRGYYGQGEYQGTQQRPRQPSQRQGQPRRRPVQHSTAQRRPSQGTSAQRRPQQSRNTQPSAQRQRPAAQSSHQKKVAQARQRAHSQQLNFGSNTPAPTTDEKQARRQSKKMADQQYTHGGKKRHPIRNFFLTVFILILALFVGVNALLYSYICKVNIRERKERTMTTASMNDANVKNILIIGSDTRSPEEYGRTDSMILLSINKSTKKITMTSFMRDMYVNIKGKDLSGNAADFWGKLNSAYVYGGAELLMDTIEYNFDIAVDDYVYIDFLSFVEIIDSIGGIEVSLTDEEALGMIDPMAEQNKILGKTKGSDYLTSGGKLNLNGNQALAYARLRYVGNADFQRTDRQREVITKIIDKVKSSGLGTIHSFAKTTCSQLTTNMSRADMMFMVYKALFSVNYEMQSLRLPQDGEYTYGDHDGQSTLDVDLDACKARLRKTIYE